MATTVLKMPPAVPAASSTSASENLIGSRREDPSFRPEGNAASPPRKYQWHSLICSYGSPVPVAPHVHSAGGVARPLRPRPVRVEPGRRAAPALAPRSQERPEL